MQQDSEVKRKMMNLIVDKAVFKENDLCFHLKAPFDMILLAKKTSNMLPDQDSNLGQGD